MKHLLILISAVLLIPVPLFSQVVDTNLSVGSPSGNFDISSLGGATYNIPIEVPEGLHGFHPQLAICYNSQAGNGLVGWGCELAGISVITRGPRDVYHDGMANGISYTSNDAFFLDGQRLIRLSSGADTIVFCPEADPYTRVIMYNASNNASGSWFRVLTTDGQRLTYGSIGCKQTNIVNNVTKDHAWYVSKCERVADGDLSSITYTYNSENFYLYPAQIMYGSIISQRHQISFSYENRPDEQGFSLVGRTGTMKKRLKNITSSTYTSSQWKTFRTYTLNYDGDTSDATLTGYSRLASVSVSNVNNEPLNPIAWQWSTLPEYSTHANVSNTILTQSTTQFTFTDFSLMAADMNGDGTSDLIQHAYVGEAVNGHRQYYNFYFIHYLQKGSGGSPSSTSTMYFKLPPDVTALGSWTQQRNVPLVGDIDGDGLNDMVFPYLVLANGNTAQYYVVLNKNIQNYNTYFNDCCYVTLQHSSETPAHALADFNHDGYADLAILERGGSGNSYDFYLLKGKSDFSVNNLESYHTTLTLSSAPKQFFTSDYNGDGLVDLMVVMTDGYKIFWNNGNGLSANTFSDSSVKAGTNLKDNVIVREGDFNGDGVVDFLTNAKDDGKWYIYTGNGGGSYTSGLACTLDVYEQSATSKDDNDFTCLVYDIDGDGKSDVLISKSIFKKHHDLVSTYYRFEKTKTYWLFSNGSTLTQLSSATSNKESDSRTQYYAVGDFDGNGLSEFCCHGYDCYASVDADVDPELRFYNNSNWLSGTGKISKIWDGIGNSIQIGYKPLTESSVYTNTRLGYHSDATPLLTITVPLSVVSSVEQRFGAAVNIVTSYSYQDLQYHNQGRGMLGFNSAISDCQATDVYTETSISRNSQTLLPQQVTVNRMAGNFVSHTQDTYHSSYYCNTKALYNALTQSVETDYDGHTTTTSYVCDSTRNNVPTSVVVQGFDGARVSTTYNNYVQCGNQYLPGGITETRHHPDHGSDYTERATFEYNAKGLKTKEVSHAGTSKALTTVYQYNTWNNLIETTTTGADIEQIKKQYVYDATCHYVARSTEQDYLVKTYTYDAWGHKLTETDLTRSLFPQTTTYEYDGWGNLSKVTSPTGVTTTYSRNWSSAPYCYTMIEKTQGEPYIQTWFDQKGRECQKQTVGPKGLLVKENTYYNYLDLPWRRINCHGEQMVTETMTYDARGRLLSETDDFGKDITYTYGASSVTKNEHGRSYTTTYDSWGNVKMITDPVTSVTYMYHACGKPKSAISAGANITMTYDDCGNQTSLTDPDAGTMSYSYDALGRLRTQTDGNGNLTTNTYNARGQLSQSTIGTTSDTYTYGQTSADNGLLLSVNRGDFTESYQYDNYGRKIQQTRSYSSSLSRSVSCSYDSLGRVATRIYPDNLQISYQYDANGFLNRMISGNAVLYEMLAYQAPALNMAFSRVKLGSSLSRYTEYDKAGRLTLSVTEDGNGNYIAPQIYTYDEATGNMTSRSFDSVSYEHFTYDNLDRLTRAETDDGDYTFVVYDNNGNIDVKYGNVHPIGSYYYNGSRPHAVTDIENPQGSVDLPADNISVTYNELGKASNVSEGFRPAVSYAYGPDHQRWKALQYLSSNSYYNTIYFQDYEEQIFGSAARRSFVYLEGGVLAVSINGAAHQFYYIHTDHQGSVVAITDGNGNYVFKASYDAWGRQTVEQNTIGFFRGYTGHEMMKEGGLVNMNGRIYDPATALFLSPDNYVQEPLNSQNFNRYSYCLNNQLKYTDPSGEFWHIVIGAVVGGVANLAANWNNVDGFWQGVAAFTVGAGGGAVIAATGGAGASLMTIAGVSAASGAMTSATNSLIAQTGKNFRGIENVNWSDVMTNSFMGAVAGLTSGSFGYYAQKVSWTVNGIQLKSPILKSALFSSLVSGSSHVFSGTVVGLLEGHSFSTSFINSFKDIGKSMAIGGAIGVASTIGMCYANKVNPWTGESKYDPIIKALELEQTIERIENGQKLPQYQHDGTIFRNDNSILPSIDGVYREWVVPNPNLPSYRAGTWRIITSDNAWYYTPDHYRMFIRIK